MSSHYRFVLGLAVGGITVAGNLYIVELADKSIRGTMATIPNFAILLGSLYTVGMGAVLHWHYLTIVCALPTVVLLVNTFFLPDSPSFLVVKGHTQKALEILRRLRGPYANVKQEVAELKRINIKVEGGWKKLLEIRLVKRMIVVIMLFVFQQFCGHYVFLVQTSRVLKATGTPLNLDLAVVVVGVVRLLGSLAVMVLVDRIGRRSCLVISYSIAATALTILGTAVYLAENAEPEDNTYLRYEYCHSWTGQRNL